MADISSMGLTVEDLREMYRLMVMGRRFTERALELFTEGRVPTGLHPSAGQEAVGVGACYGLRPSDWVLPSLRTTEAFWTRGVTMLQNLNAMMGNSGSVSMGKESFHHSGYPDLGIIAGPALVGSQIPIAVGAAVALRMKKTDDVMVCFFGDGAAARERYERGEYAEATQQYEALIDRGYRDATLYFNLGNAHFESGDLGRAILSYLRARELSPRDPDIRDNLELARAMTVDRIAAERGPLVESVSYFGHRWVTPDELGTAAILLWVASGIAIGALLVWRVFPLRRVLHTVTVFATVATAMSLLLVVSMTYANPYDDTGVVTAAAVEVVSGPGPQYSEEFTLFSGAQVRVTDSRHGWLRIELPGGELRGRVSSHTIDLVGGSVLYAPAHQRRLEPQGWRAKAPLPTTEPRSLRGSLRRKFPPGQ